MKENFDTIMCRSVAVAVFLTITLLESIFLLLFFGAAANLFGLVGFVSAMRVAALIGLFNFVLFVFAMKYQESAGIAGGICSADCRKQRLNWRNLKNEQ